MCGILADISLLNPPAPTACIGPNPAGLPLWQIMWTALSWNSFVDKQERYIKFLPSNFYELWGLDRVLARCTCGLSPGRALHCHQSLSWEWKAVSAPASIHDLVNKHRPLLLYWVWETAMLRQGRSEKTTVGGLAWPQTEDWEGPPSPTTEG